MRILAALLLSLVPLSLSAKPLEPPKPNEKWTTVRVDEFEIISNASPAATKNAAEDLVRMRDALGQVTKLKVRSPLPITVFLFNNERTFAPYRNAILGRENASGFFFSTNRGNFILMRTDTSDGVDRVIYHELTHYFVRNTVPDLPAWLNEAIAEYYSTFRTSGDEIHIGRPIGEHVLWLRDEALIPLADLFAVTHDSPLYNEGSRAGVFYAESWALLHYLSLGSDERRKQLPQFLGLIGQNKPASEAFQTAFGTTYEKLEQELRHYVRKHAFSFIRYPRSESKPISVPAPEPLTYDTLLYEFGHMLAHAGPEHMSTAERFLTASLQKNPDSAPAHADLGRLYYIGGRLEDSEKSYARAISLGSTDPVVYMTAADSLIEGELQPEQVRKARELYTHATTLDPESAIAWAGIGVTYVLSQDDPKPGITALEKSLALAPGREETQIHLAQLYAQADRFDEAIAITRRLAERASNPAVGSFAKKLLARMESHAVRVALTDRLNEAVKMANAGQHAEALAIIDALMPGINDPDVLAQARSFRDSLAETIERKKPRKK